jgi:hypothetical protein
MIENAVVKKLVNDYWKKIDDHKNMQEDKRTAIDLLEEDEATKIKVEASKKSVDDFTPSPAMAWKSHSE